MEGSGEAVDLNIARKGERRGEGRGEESQTEVNSPARPLLSALDGVERSCRGLRGG